MPSFQLIVRRGPKAGEIFELKTQTIILGRDSSADISINDPEVSRNHCRLILDRSYFIQDLGSTNGTFVDGQRLGGEPQRLHSGQIVQLGSNVTLLYQETSGEDAIMSTMVAPGSEAAAILEPAEPAIVDPFDESQADEEPDFTGLEAILDDDEERDGDSAPLSSWSNPSASFEGRETGGRPVYGSPPYDELEYEDEEDNRRTTIIIAVVVGGLLLCCCCLLLAGIAAYLQSEGQLQPLLGWLPVAFYLY